MGCFWDDKTARIRTSKIFGSVSGEMSVGTDLIARNVLRSWSVRSFAGAGVSGAAAGTSAVETSKGPILQK